MDTSDDHDNDMPSRVCDVQRRERDQVRELSERMAAAALILVERFGWPRAKLIAALDYELRERLLDAAEDDATFREWYRQWRKENPGAG